MKRAISAVDLTFNCQYQRTKKSKFRLIMQLQQVVLLCNGWHQVKQVEGHFNTGLFNPKLQPLTDFSTPDFTTMNFSTPDISTMNLIFSLFQTLILKATASKNSSSNLKEIQFIKLDVSNWRMAKIKCRYIGGKTWGRRVSKIA